MYDGFYHVLGGQLYLGTETFDPFAGAASAAAAKPLQNGLRTTFLHATLTDPAATPSPTNPWILPRLAEYLDKADLPFEEAAAVSSIVSSSFSSTSGTLTWSKPVLSRLWKKGSNVYSDKWLPHAQPFLPVDADAKKETARRLFICELPAVAFGEGGEQGGGCDRPASTLMEISEDGEVFRTTTFASACRLLLELLCTRSLEDVAAVPAIAEFAGVPESSVRGLDVQERVNLIFPIILDYIKSWQCIGSLDQRQTKVAAVIERFRPDIITLAEYDEQWASLGVEQQGGGEKGKKGVYETCERDGGMTSAVLFNKDKFSLVGGGNSGASSSIDKIDPKNSCVTRLKMKDADVEVFVAAVHLESGDPGQVKAVRRRARAMEKIRRRVEEQVKEWKAEGVKGLVLVGGDFNSVREEFVYGNGRDFFDSAGVKKIVPQKAEPAGEDGVFVVEEEYARLEEGSGRLLVKCEGIDGGWLKEGSFVEDGEAWTTMSKHMNYVLDYLLVGGVGLEGEGGLEMSAIRAVGSKECSECGGEAVGLRNAAREVGSDHLPVGCVVNINV
jgi:endonuclease/exonuclease/phosphatase family metal-dependent hydrolase